MEALNQNGIKHYQKFVLQPIAYYNKEWHKFDMLFHSHNYYEIMYAEEGEFDVRLYRFICGKRVDEQTVHLTKDMAIFIHSDIFHRLVVKDNAKVLNLEFERRKCDHQNLFYDFSEVVQNCECLKKMFDADSFYYVFTNANDVISPIKKIQCELTLSLCTKNERGLLLNAYITEFFIKLGKIWESNRVRQGICYVKKSIKYINEHYAENITAEILSDYLKISKGYLHKVIKQETGKTLVEIVNEFRIGRALQLLKSTSYPIVDIAIECGFNNRQNFYYIFKKVVGKSAGEYRRDEYAADTYSFGEDYETILQENEEEKFALEQTKFNGRGQ